MGSYTPSLRAEVVTDRIHRHMRTIVEYSDSRYWLGLAQLYTELAFATLPVPAEHESAAKDLLLMATGSWHTAEWLTRLAEILDERPAEAEAVLDELTEPGLAHLAHTSGYERQVARPLVTKLATRCATAAAHLEQLAAH